MKQLLNLLTVILEKKSTFLKLNIQKDSELILGVPLAGKVDMENTTKEDDKYSNNEDSILIKEALLGSEKAYATLLLKYRSFVFFSVKKIIRKKSDCEDIVLEVFGKAFANLHTYSSTYTFGTWLNKIAINTSIDYLRRQKGTHLSFDQIKETDPESNGEHLSNPAPNPEEYLILKQRTIFLQRHMMKLKKDYQKLIDMRYFKEMSYEEIAKELDLPLGTVKTQLFRARNKLYDLFTNEDLK